MCLTSMGRLSCTEASIGCASETRGTVREHRHREILNRISLVVKVSARVVRIDPRQILPDERWHNVSMQRPTIRDIAEAAGVSPSAVSFALNGRPGVSQATRERIRST